MRPARWKNIAVSLATVLLFIALTELGFRWANDEQRVAEEARRASIWQKSDDATLIYVHRPRWRDITDGHGILRHGSDATSRRPPGRQRVLLIGDSVAAMPELTPDERFSGRLEAALASRGHDIEVLNFAVNGYKTLQEARLLETAAAPFEADAIVVAYCMNDPGNTLTPVTWFLDVPAPRSYLWDFIKRRLGVGKRPSDADPRYSLFVPLWGPGESTSTYWFSLYRPDSETWATVIDGFARIATVAQARDVPVVLVIFPLVLPPDWRVAEVQPFHEQVRRAAAARGFHVVDLLPSLSTEPVDVLRKEAGDIYHFSPQGLAAAAIATAPALESALNRH